MSHFFPFISLCAAYALCQSQYVQADESSSFQTIEQLITPLKINAVTYSFLAFPLPSTSHFLQTLLV